MTRLGLTLPFSAAFTAEQYVALLRDAETRGFEAAWAGEVAGPDAITVLTLIASHTDRLRVATGVLPIQTRTPVLLGVTAATLDRIAPGRVILGLGASSRTIVEQWNGRRFVGSVQEMREAVTVVRAVMSGERVNVEGEHFQVRNFRLTVPPPPRPVPVFLAALGPAMLELAGEVADGVLLNWLSPETVGAALRHVATGAERARRSLDGFEVAAFIRTCVTDDPEPAHAILARDITGYATVDAYARFFRATGFGAEMEAIGSAWQSGDRAGAVRHVSRRLLDAVGVVGTAEFCRARIAEFAAAGLTMPVIAPFSPDRDPRGAFRRTVEAFP